MSICRACASGDCRNCPGECWCEVTHDFSDAHDYDEGDMADRATARYEKFYDRMFGDAL